MRVVAPAAAAVSHRTGQPTEYPHSHSA
ncbi:unnamed protein product [Ectocarpus sp. CCAP 1310/34]|nr:unnamed protein product [Ectocarpus sp. CCAP 1310/34]